LGLSTAGSHGSVTSVAGAGGNGQRLGGVRKIVLRRALLGNTLDSIKITIENNFAQKK